MKPITSVPELETHYGEAVPRSLSKVVNSMTPLYRAWIEASRFVVISTVGSEGTDGSPRGDEGSVVTIVDDKTLMLPDWFGNNRIDTLRNIVRDGRISLMFMVPGSNNVIRVNGTAVVSLDPDMLARFDQKGHQPRSVVVITIAEVYSQCARALMRARTWGSGDESADLPTIGELLAEQEAGFDGGNYDANWAARAEKTMW